MPQTRAQLTFKELVYRKGLRNIYITAMRPGFEMPFGYIFGTVFCYSISPRLHLLIWKTGESKPSLYGGLGIQEAHVWGGEWGGI